jgi:PAS domain S-box-containing protein
LHDGGVLHIGDRMAPKDFSIAEDRMSTIQQLESVDKIPVAVVGGGRRCLSLLQMLESDALRGLKMEIVGVADVDPEAIGLAYAESTGIFTTSDFRTLFDVSKLGMIINLTGSPEVTRQLADLSPPTVTVLPHLASRLFQEIVQEALTASRRMDEQADKISRSQAFAQALAQATIVGVMVLDTDYRIAWINEAALRATGLTQEEALGRYCFQVSHQQINPCTDPKAKCPMKDTLATGLAAHAIHEHRTADGQTSYCDISTFPLFNRAGQVVEVVEVIRDITVDLNEKLEQRTRTLKDNLARAIQEDKLIALGKMVASVAHEINNPIAAIINFAMLILESLRAGPTRPGQAAKFEKYLELTVREAQRCGKIVSNLLSFARQQPVEPKIIDLCEIVDRIIQLIHHKLELSNIRLYWQSETAPLFMWGDYNQIQQCLINLIFNAMEAMPQGGKLTIRGGCDHGPERVWVRIADSGIGIAPQDLPHIYEPFFTTKSESFGVGLGLSMVYGIIREHQGEISVQSEEGKGTEFCISLPAVPSDRPRE